MARPLPDPARPTFPAIGVLVLALCSVPGIARAQAYAESYQTWLSLTLQGNVTPDVQLYVDLNGRFYDFDDELHPFQILIRPAVGLRLSEGMYAWLGYGWTPTWSPQHAFVDEHRVWEQWSFDIPGLPGGVRVFLRTRLEQRARPTISSDVALRLRQFARVLVPLVHGVPVHLSLWDEAFVALTDSSTSAGAQWQAMGFDQNRLFVGVSISPADGVRVEVGYLSHWNVRHTSTDLVRHVLAVNAFATIR